MQSNASNFYTNAVVVAPTTTVGVMTLPVTITDPQTFFGLTNIPVTVVIANKVWSGGSGSDNNWTSNPNWASGAGPAMRVTARLLTAARGSRRT